MRFSPRISLEKKFLRYVYDSWNLFIAVLYSNQDNKNIIFCLLRYSKICIYIKEVSKNYLWLFTYISAIKYPSIIRNSVWRKDNVSNE